MSKWDRRVRTEFLGMVEVEGDQVQLVAFTFDAAKGDRYQYGWSMAIPEKGLVYKRHCYTKDRIIAKSRWYTHGLWAIEERYWAKGG